MKIELIREISGSMPSFTIDRKAFDEVGALAQAAIVDNIVRQQQASGAPIKVNAPSTLRRKRRLGLRSMSLVDLGERLVRGLKKSFTWEIGRDFVLIRPNRMPQLGRKGRTAKSPSELSGYVQRKGYTGWFGLSARSLAAVREAMRRAIERTRVKVSQKQSNR